MRVKSLAPRIRFEKESQEDQRVYSTRTFREGVPDPSGIKGKWMKLLKRQLQNDKVGQALGCFAGKDKEFRLDAGREGKSV